METKAILKALYEISYSIPLDEVQMIMDKELLKNLDEMDDELIDICMDILEKGYAEQEQKQKQEQEHDRTEKKRTGIKVRRVLAVAAIIMLIIAIAIPIAAALSHSKVSDKIVQFYSDYFHMDLRKGSTNANHYSDIDSDLIKELQERGFSDVILPSDLLNYDYSKNIFIQEGDNLTSATITIEDTESKIRGSIGITQYNESMSFIAGSGQVSSMYENVEQISVNGLDIIVFGNDDEATIRYLDKNTNYHITLDNCDIYKAVEIANSLK